MLHIVQLIMDMEILEWTEFKEILP